MSKRSLEVWCGNTIQGREKDKTWSEMEKFFFYEKRGPEVGANQQISEEKEKTVEDDKTGESANQWAEERRSLVLISPWTQHGAGVPVTSAK